MTSKLYNRFTICLKQGHCAAACPSWGKMKLRGVTEAMGASLPSKQKIAEFDSPMPLQTGFTHAHPIGKAAGDQHGNVNGEQS